MLTDINPKLPMRDKRITREFYLKDLGFKEFGSADLDDYLMVEREILFKFTSLNLKVLTQKKIMVKFILERIISTNFTNLCLIKEHVFTQMEN